LLYLHSLDGVTIVLLTNVIFCKFYFCTVFLSNNNNNNIHSRFLYSTLNPFAFALVFLRSFFLFNVQQQLSLAANFVLSTQGPPKSASPTNRFHEIFKRVGLGTRNKRLHFETDPDTRFHFSHFQHSDVNKDLTFKDKDKDKDKDQTLKDKDQDKD